MKVREKHLFLHELATHVKISSAGSGKSRVLLMKPLEFKDDPNFNAVLFRKSIKQLEGAGGLWPEGKKLYRHFNPQIKESKNTIVFPSGASIQMTYLDHENDAEDNHQGLNIAPYHSNVISKPI